MYIFILFTYGFFSSFLVKWNFVGQNEKHLSLEVGETVHIQEVCEGKMLLNKSVIRFVSVVQILYT